MQLPQKNEEPQIQRLTQHLVLIHCRGCWSGDQTLRTISVEAEEIPAGVVSVRLLGSSKMPSWALNGKMPCKTHMGVFCSSSLEA